jgi:hypothetical protein
VTHDPVAAKRAGTILHLDKGTLLERAAEKSIATNLGETPR